MHKEVQLWSLFSFKFYAQCFLDAAVGAMNTPNAVSLAASAIDSYGVQIESEQKEPFAIDHH